VICEADFEVSKHGTVACGECRVVGLANTEPSYYDNGPLRIRLLVQFGQRCDENE
jgi:ferredoxin-like protein FixX